MGRNIVVTEATGQHIEDRLVEIVERKGIGHPDSLCDGIAERISRDYTRWCEKNVNGALHHNFDKVQLVAGEVNVAFGGGEMVKPIRIQIAGRGTPQYDGRLIPMDTLAIEAAKAHLRETMRYLDPDRHCVVDSYAGRGASELMDLAVQVVANDTSFGCSHWPRSGLEHIVFEAARFINQDLIDDLPIGEDVKVMGCRHGNEITLTVALPFIATEVRDAAEYESLKADAQSAIVRYAGPLDGRRVTVAVNTADRPERNDYYLTLTGTSAEMGDDGSVGRGNRLNGLITPFRSASLEAPCGKNPISHVGKVYNVMALRTAQDIVERVPAVQDVSVYLLSQIGQPLDQPLMATASVRPADGTLTKDTIADVEAVIDDHLANDLPRIRELLRDGDLALY